MSPDADGRFRGMVVPRVPWHEEPEDSHPADWLKEALDELGEEAERRLSRASSELLADEAEQGYNLSQGRRVTREQVERAAGG